MTPKARDLREKPVIVGSGVAGLMTALLMAPEPVVLLSKGSLGGDSSSMLAQGGFAASLGVDDSPELHLADTLAAGDGLCDEAAARRIVGAAPEAVETLRRFGVRFDQRPDGAPALGLEAAHSRHRIVHAAGDATGRELVHALAEAVRRTRSITVLEGMEARRVLVEDGAVAGLLVATGRGAAVLSTGRVVLATGGIGGLFEDTTNPPGSCGQGLALAARAGAELADLEFVQFHPTALDTRRRPMPLVSEAVRGEGAWLVDEHGDRFLADAPGAELAPRDVVARAVWRQLAAGHRVFLDARHCLGARFAERFPTIAGFCHEAGIDPATAPIPVRPAVHYHMGGIAVDGEGRSSVAGLWACGEVASTGLHGANRLASNSLTEAVVCAGQVATSVVAAPSVQPRRLLPVEMPPEPDATPIRAIVSRALGIVRDGETLREAITTLRPLAAASDPAAVALMMTVAALDREESRGAHCRADLPQRDARSRSSRLTLDAALEMAAEVADAPTFLARRA